MVVSVLVGDAVRTPALAVLLPGEGGEVERLHGAPARREHGAQQDVRGVVRQRAQAARGGRGGAGAGEEAGDGPAAARRDAASLEAERGAPHLAVEAGGEQLAHGAVRRRFVTSFRGRQFLH